MVYVPCYRRSDLCHPFLVNALVVKRSASSALEALAGSLNTSSTRLVRRMAVDGKEPRWGSYHKYWPLL